MRFRVTGLNMYGTPITKDVKANSKQEILSNLSRFGFSEIIHAKQLKG